MRCELKDHVGEKRWSLNWLMNLGPTKRNTFCKFSHLHVRKHLNQIYVSLCPIALPQGGKMKHHWGNRRNNCKTTTLYRSYASLSDTKWNATCTSCHKMVGMCLYKQKSQRPKWKDLKTSNVETQVQVDASGVRVKEGIGLGWSQGFGLDELDV
jgi:hypothetical protein